MKEDIKGVQNFDLKLIVTYCLNFTTEKILLNRVAYYESHTLWLYMLLGKH